MQQSVLVTGGYGFLGRATAQQFKSHGYRVVGVGNGRWYGEEMRTHGFDEWLDASVTMANMITLKDRFDVIVHCAGNGSVGYSLANPLQDFKKSVDSTAELLEFVRISNPNAVVVFPSSAGVYGAKDDQPIRESDNLNPISPYGYNKRLSEQLCESYSKIFGLKTRVIRFFSIYGPGLTKQLLWDASNKLFNAEREIEFAGTGQETRDFIFVNDAAALIFELAAQNNQFILINGASGIRVTVKSLIGQLRDKINQDLNITFGGSIRNGDPQYYHADISLASELGWKPSTSLNKGLDQYIAWFKKYKNEN
jgi:UDP-glucose 4-epimerase